MFGVMHSSDGVLVDAAAAIMWFAAIVFPIMIGMSIMTRMKQPTSSTPPMGAGEGWTPLPSTTPAPPPPPPIAVSVRARSPVLQEGNVYKNTHAAGKNPAFASGDRYTREEYGNGSDDDGEEEAKRDVQMAVEMEEVEELAELEDAGYNSKLTEPAAQSSGNRVLSQFLKVIEASPQSHAEAVRILRRVRRLVTQQYPEANVHAFGSAMNGLGDGGCDVDIDISYPVPVGQGRHTLQQSQKLLMSMVDLLTHHGFVVHLTALSAKVPVCTMIDTATNRQVDITVNNGLPVFNTRLLRYYAKLHPDGLVRKLVLLVKHWAKNRDVAGAKDKNLSSYGLTLMVIFYLQVGLPEPLLPSLQGLSKDLHEGLKTWTQDGKSFDVSMVSATTCLKSWVMPTVVPDLDTLIRGFFDFYSARFDFANDMISVRMGTKSTREGTTMSNMAQQHLGGQCWIEDPIETTRNLNCVLTDATFQSLQTELKLAASVLRSPVTTFAQLIPMPQQKHRPEQRKTRGNDEHQYENSWNVGERKQWRPSEYHEPQRSWNGPDSYGKRWGAERAWDAEPAWSAADGWGDERTHLRRQQEREHWGDRSLDRSRTWAHPAPPAMPDRRQQRASMPVQGAPMPAPGTWSPPMWQSVPHGMPKPPSNLQKGKGSGLPHGEDMLNLPKGKGSGSGLSHALPQQISPPTNFVRPLSAKPPDFDRRAPEGKGSQRTPPTNLVRPSSEKPVDFSARTDDRRMPEDQSGKGKGRKARSMDEPPESFSTFAKVMKQLELPAAANAGQPDYLLKDAGQLLIDPERDVHDVQNAPAAQQERRLWEKLYNRALCAGCTHRQSLTVTENILKRGKTAAIDVLRSKQLMQKMTAGMRNSPSLQGRSPA